MTADTTGQATVLVVDDDVQLREAIASYLSDDYAVVEADSADTAVTLLSTGSVDFVLSDVRMPGSMDGFGLATWLRANHPWLPVLLMTGYSERTTADHPDRLPLWHKPFDFRRLSEHIQHVLRMQVDYRIPTA